MPRPLLIAVLVAAAGGGVLTALLLRGGEADPTGISGPATSAPGSTAPTTEPEPAPEPPPSEPPGTEPPPPAEPPPGIPTVAPPWRGKGAFVWHETDVDPVVLAERMAAGGFDWLAVLLHEGTAVDPVEPSWIERFRAAGGPVVGGWGVLRDRPEEEAALAARLLREHGLGFYVANAEAEYGPAGDVARSRRFVEAFRGEVPDAPAALSTLCTGGGLDLAPWRDAGFALLPQAYVNQFGPEVAPAACVAALAPVYPRDRLHPTLGTYPSAHDVTVQGYLDGLRAAGTTGFSLYLAETDVAPEDWIAFGATG